MFSNWIRTLCACSFEVTEHRPTQPPRSRHLPSVPSRASQIASIMALMQIASQTISANACISGNSGAVHAKVVNGTPRTILTTVLFTARCSRNVAQTRRSRRDGRSRRQSTLRLRSIVLLMGAAIGVARCVSLRESHKGNDENLARPRVGRVRFHCVG
jgi:hypothetical protein